MPYFYSEKIGEAIKNKYAPTKNGQPSINVDKITQTFYKIRANYIKKPDCPTKIHKLLCLPVLKNHSSSNP